MVKTTEEILSSIKKRIAYSNTQLDLTSGNVVTDLGVESFAEELTSCYTEEERIRLLYLFDASAFTETEADALANSFGVYRLSATKATGTVIFGATTLPAAGSQFIIPVGTTISTGDDGTKQITFTTTTEGVIDSTTPINPTTNYYEVSVNVQASAVGSTNNVGPGAINTIVGSVSGVSVVYNQNSIVNGTDTETKESLINRVKLNLVGYVYGTKSSFLAKALSYPKVTDAVIVDPNNEFSVRGPGTVDIYILGEEISSYSQTISDKTQSVLLTKNPVTSGTAVVVFDDGSTIAEGAGFIISKDTSSVYAGSSQAKDTIVWEESVFTDVVLQHNYYTVTYAYNKLVEDMQEEFNSEDNHILTSDVLVRTTSKLEVAMDFDIVTLAGYDGASIRNAVVYQIQNYINNFKLNETLRQSDIIGIVEGVPGVDYVKLPMRQFNLLGKDGVADVSSSPLEYIRIEAANILIG